MYTSSPEYLLRICEGRSHGIHCYGGKRIFIISANYGRLTGGHICGGPVRTTYCGAPHSLTKVRTACQGKQSCVLQATNSVFGDPCRGTKKYIEVRSFSPTFFYYYVIFFPYGLPLTENLLFIDLDLVLRLLSPTPNVSSLQKRNVSARPTHKKCKRPSVVTEG